MTQQSTNSTTIIGLSIIIALIQLFDIAIHVRTNQVEPIRILSNVIIILWVASILWHKFPNQIQFIAMRFIGAYLLLNIIFILFEGIRNTENDEIRIMLLILIQLTSILSICLMTIYQRNSQKPI